MSNDEREGGEITDSESPPLQRDTRDERRYRDRDRERPPRDDVYVPRGAYDRDRSERHWERERERERDRRRDSYYDRRDDRAWTRDTGYRGSYRDERRGWRDDRDHERYYDRYRDRDQRSTHERPRPRDEWAGDERRRGDTYERKPDRDTYRPDVGAEDQYRPRRRTSPEPPLRSERKRSPSRSRDDTPRFQRRRDDSVDSRKSGPRRGRDDSERHIQAYRKRERSRSPIDQDSRAQRRLRTNSPEPIPTTRRRKSPSPVARTHRQEEKLPEHQASRPRHLGVPVISAASSSQQSPVLLRAMPAERPVSPSKVRPPAAPTPVRTAEAPAQSPTKKLETPITPSASRPIPSVPRPPPRKRSPEIPEFRGTLISAKSRPWVEYNFDRSALFADYARSSVELHRVKLESEISAVELRSVELRRIFAEQQRQRALEA